MLASWTRQHTDSVYLSRGRGYGRALCGSTVSYGQGPVERLGRIVRIGLAGDHDYEDDDDDEDD